MTRVLIAADDSAESRMAAQAAHRLPGDTSEYWLMNVGQTVTSSTGAWGMACPIDAAHERLADVIVVGSRERGWLDRLLHSSVSDSVVKNADIPVLVVK